MYKGIIISPSQNASATLLCGLVWVLSGCADNAALREQERAHYDALESELINQQLAQERQRMSEMRVSDRPAEPDAVSAADTQAGLNSSQPGTPDTTAQPNGAFSESIQSMSAATETESETETETETETENPTRLDSGGIWSLKQVPDPRDGSPICVVASNTQTIKNGPLDTHVSVFISNENVFLRTDATFNTKTPENGYRVDAGLPIPFDHFLNELTAVVDTGYERLTNAMQAGTALTVFFAYQPQLSSLETHRLELDLTGIIQPLASLGSCQ